MRPIWKGFVSFGLVTIPVGVGIAQDRSRDVSFRTLSRETLRPVKQKRWDVDRDVEVTADETVKGYEFTKGQFVPVEDEELERFAARQEKTIEILQFVDVAEVDPVYFERAYWVEPQERAERPYALLVAAMERTGRAAIGRFVLSTKEHLVLLRPHRGALTLETLHYPEDIRARDLDGIVERVGGVEVKGAELDMAEQLVESLSKPFDPAAYPNETRAALLAFLDAKAAGTPQAEEASLEQATAPVVDIMAALKASLAASRAKDGAADAPSDERGTRTSSGRTGAKPQLSIEDSRLRTMTADDEGEGDDVPAGEAPTPKRRSRKAS